MKNTNYLTVYQCHQNVLIGRVRVRDFVQYVISYAKSISYIFPDRWRKMQHKFSDKQIMTLHYFADVNSKISGYLRIENETGFQSLPSAAWTPDKFSL